MSRSQYSQWYADRRWRALRLLQLQKQPICEACEEQGKLTPATICDHIEAHKGDRDKFWNGPFQSLCKYHHDVKTIMEDGGLNTGANTHPDWLPKPACPVVLVSGPPGAGKTTYCEQERRRSDTVIDLDECFLDVCGTHGHKADKQHLNGALRLRNKMLANLATKALGKALVIVSCPAMREAEWWLEKLGASHMRLDPGMETCLERVQPSRRVLVRNWYAKAQANEWQPHKRVGADVDGTPTDPSHHWNGEG